MKLGWSLLLMGSRMVLGSMKSCSPFNITTLTISKLHEQYQTKQWSVTNITQCYLHRIQYLNPQWNAIIKVNPSALGQANLLDELVPMNSTKRPLYGVPILITDYLATTNLMETSLGSPILKNMVPREEAKILFKLRQAGAIILGKTNVAELSGFKFGLNRFGYSEEGRQVKDPKNILKKLTGGNLGMVAALVGHLGLAGITTTLNEVILGPNSISNSLFSFSPSSKLISNQGIVPSNAYDKLAILANNLHDVILISNTLSNSIKHPLPSISVNLFLNRALIPKIKTIGIIKNSYYRRQKNSRDSFLAPFYFLEYLDISYKLVDFTVPNDLLFINHFGLIAKFKSNIFNYLQHQVINNFNITNYQKLIQFNSNNTNLQNSSRTLSRSPQEDSMAYNLFRQTRTDLRLQLHQLITSNNLSVIVLLNDPQNHITILPKLLKLPFITIPTLPISITVVGLNDNSNQLTQLANILNQFIIKPYKYLQ